MKITIYTPDNSPVTIEGDTDELNAVIDRLMNQPVTIKTATDKSVKTPAKVTVSSNMKVKEFLESIYSYAPDPNTFSGRGHAIAQAICDFNTNSVTEICRKTNSKPTTVHSNIRRLRLNGAVINVLDDNVTLISIPNKRFTKKKWTPRNPNGSQRNTSSETNILTGIKLS